MGKVLKTDNIEFTYGFKTLQNSGNLVYEYNPFRNYRLSQSIFEYKDRLYSYEELNNKFGISLKKTVEGKDITAWKDITTQEEAEDLILNSTDKFEWIGVEGTPPILRRKGELVDFETSELKFDLNHPVNILPQYSYDNSVNLIITDGKSQPRLINSRFSALGKNKYQIVDRKGTNDTNIYDQGAEFDVDTSLHKKTKTIPNLKYYGTFASGNLPIGNYHFYIKYMDADGNESDFIAESGLVSVFIGNTPYNINTGVRLQNSHKGVSFQLTNLDSGYQYLSVYYTRSTGDIFENSTTNAYKINQKYLIDISNSSSIRITGFEEVTEVPIDEINLQYQIFGSAETLASCQNRLFFGNISQQNIDYQNLADVSLRFLPFLDKKPYKLENIVDEQYSPDTNYINSYYNSKYIYEMVGYWPGEIYRFGIVYILNDGSLSPVFNVRGCRKLTKDVEQYSEFTLYRQDDKKQDTTDRQYVTYDEQTYNIIAGDKVSTDLENCKGVVTFPPDSDAEFQVYGIKFNIGKDGAEEQKIKKYLQDLGIKGYFFVRQKRIPTILCQALTIGIDKLSHTPVIPYNNKYIAECFLGKDSPRLTHDYLKRTFEISKNFVDYAAICPEYDVDYPYYNSLFSGDSFNISRLRKVELSRLSYNPRFYYENREKSKASTISDSTVRIQSVEDNQKLAAIDDTMFSARAGEAEEVHRLEYVSIENKTSDATNLLRGIFGPFLGLTGYSGGTNIINIYIPGYSENNRTDYYLIRYNDKASFYAISDKISLSSNETPTCFRGDCYICQFTHRVNRNFQDSSAPTNDEIVDPKCWENNWRITDGVVNTENLDKINLGDLNAIQMGQWITFTVRSTKNLNIRTLDDSNVDETALFGHSRGYYPYYPASTKGAYKISEALCYNKGFEKSVSERYNFEVPDVPAFRNDFSNRISYSDIHITDAFQNGFRVFRGTNYRDYPKTYGSITKIIELGGSLLCVFEHGIALIPVNERTVAGDGAGGNVFINTANVLPENPNVISDTYGSQWRDSVIKTPNGVYGVDTVGKKIWRTNGRDFECISDIRVQEFLNQNITLTEREITPIIGIRNVKTHFNAFKNDVMFTFYDNLEGFEERVWNLCYNEVLKKWVTFYSWVPSYSENIDNQYFSFDRNTSKWIAKLGISKKSNNWSNGITVEETTIDKSNWSTKLNIPETKAEYELVRDNYKNYNWFEIDTDILKLKTGGLEHFEKQELPIIYLNIRAIVYDTVKTEEGTEQNVELKRYENTIALILKSKLQSLTTDFWKHGQSGIIDIKDKILPTHWYGKPHPFEFEFVVADNPDKHKIFDNLEIIGNKAEPESFHYEIVGECYDFAKDKKNMYIRQEATKELYQFNGSDIVFNPDYKGLISEHRPLTPGDPNPQHYDKSTIFPLYYCRQDTINEIEDSYHLYGRKDHYGKSDKNFSALAGAEIVRYKNLDEYRIWNHAKAVDVKEHGLLRGNMYYKEDKWDVQINPINLVQKNETDQEWDNIYKRTSEDQQYMVPAECNLFPPPTDHYKRDGKPEEITLPDDWTRNIVSWPDYQKRNKEAKLKDKFVKIRIRYSGKDLAIISAIRTLYSISYA